MNKRTTGTVAAKSRPAPNTKARSSAKGRRPVLTSPWKIGVLVSLMLVLVGLAVGAYFAILYRIEFSWLSISRSGFRFDSFGFFKQMFPLVAAITVTSLLSYFLVASAVRRYKFYLDSGQDYRKMISLAESVDDLTNPAQIARLSPYPELQSVLRSYGDQIREISQDIVQPNQSNGYDDLETDVEALLGGGDAAGSALEAKPYAAVLRRISDLRSSHRAQIDELEKRDEHDRRTIGTVTLAYGRIVEATNGVGEELAELTKSIGELGHASRGLAAIPAAPGAAAPAKGGAAVGGLESSVRKLEEGGRVLQELSEENNGIAIGLALAAARGPVDQHELAAFAERVRVTAERFQKLSGSVAAMARELVAARYEMKDAPAGSAPAAGPVPAAQARLVQTIQSISTTIVERGGRLERWMGVLSGELREVRALLRGGPAEDATEERLGSGRAAVRAAEEPVETAEFHIDRGSTWGGMTEAESPDAAAVTEETADAHEAEPEPEPDRAARRNGPAPREETQQEEAAAEPADFSDMSSLRNLDAPAAAQPAPGGEPEAGDGGWMQMPGQGWRPVTVRNAEPASAPEAEKISVAVQAADEASSPSNADDEERVYDLAELGAVEYIEETPVQR